MTELLSDEQVCAAYIELRQRVVAMLRDVSDAEGDAPVPACPQWRVRDVVAHLVGVPEDILANRLAGITSDEWTQAQIDRHAGEPLSALVDQFAAQSSTFDAVLPFIPSPRSSQFVMDAVTHEHDLREALGHSGGEDSLAVQVALAWLRTHICDAPIEAPQIVAFRALTGRLSVTAMNELGLPGESIAKALVGTPLRPPAN